MAGGLHQGLNALGLLPSAKQSIRGRSGCAVVFSVGRGSLGWSRRDETSVLALHCLCSCSYRAVRAGHWCWTVHTHHLSTLALQNLPLKRPSWYLQRRWVSQLYFGLRNVPYLAWLDCDNVQHPWNLCVSLQLHHVADRRQTQWPETLLRRAPASPPTKRRLGVGLSFAQSLADACHGALLWDSQVPCRKPASHEAIHHLKARDGESWQMQFMNRGFAVWSAVNVWGFFSPHSFQWDWSQGPYTYFWMSGCLLGLQGS